MSAEPDRGEGGERGREGREGKEGGREGRGGELNRQKESEEDKESLVREPGCFARAFNTVFQVGRCSFRGVQSPSSAPVFGVVVHKHVVGDGQDVTLHAHRSRHNHLRKGKTDGNHTISITLIQTPANVICSVVCVVALNYQQCIINSLYGLSEDIYFEGNMLHLVFFLLESY